MSGVGMRHQLDASQQILEPWSVAAVAPEAPRNLGNPFYQEFPGQELVTLAYGCPSPLGTDTAFFSISSDYYPEKKRPFIPLYSFLGSRNWGGKPNRAPVEQRPPLSH